MCPTMGTSLVVAHSALLSLSVVYDLSADAGGGRFYKLHKLCTLWYIWFIKFMKTYSYKTIRYFINRLAQVC